MRIKRWWRSLPVMLKVAAVMLMPLGLAFVPVALFFWVEVALLDAWERSK